MLGWLLRFLAVLVLVLATWNPEGHSFVHWLGDWQGGIGSTRELDSIFDNFFRGIDAGALESRTSGFVPRIDVNENAQEITVSAELPGMDEKDIEFQKAGQYTEGMLRLDNELKNLGIPIKMDYSPLEALVSYQERVRTLTTLLYAVGAPLVVLALLFIGLTSVIVIQEYSQEIAMLRSRGASRVEVLLMNVAETLVLLLLAMPASLLLGWAASNVMGQTESFMRFTQRPLLPFSYNGVNLPALFLAIGLTILARLTPAWYCRNVRSLN